MDLEQGDSSPVNIKLNFRNITLSGLSHAKVYKISGFNRNPNGDKLDIRFKAPEIAVIGPYKSIGRVLVLPIQGEGMCNMTMQNVDFMMRFITKAVVKGGKTFMKIDKSKLNFETTR